MDNQINFPGNNPADNYLVCDDYKGDEGFFKFNKEAQYYFSFNANGKTYLRSQGYSSELSRDNGIKSVRRNSLLDERWIRTKTKNGKHYYSLKAGNQQEIARSCNYDTEEERDKDYSWVRGENSVIGLGAKEIDGVWYSAADLLKNEKTTPVNVRRLNEYLPCEEYKGKQGFIKFKKNGEYYFAFNGDDGVTYLRSEGYTNEPGRDNGINSILRNAGIKERWVRSFNEENKNYYYSLKAVNKQEIARSCEYENEEDMLEALTKIRDGNMLISLETKISKGEYVPKSNNSDLTAVDNNIMKSQELNDPTKEKDESVTSQPVIEKKGGCGRWWIWILLLIILIIVLAIFL